MKTLKEKYEILRSQFIEVDNYAEATHEEITIGSHVDLYPKFVAQTYAGVKRDKTVYLKRIES